MPGACRGAGAGKDLPDEPARPRVAGNGRLKRIRVESSSMLQAPATIIPEEYLPSELPPLEDHQTALPAIAKDARLVALIEQAVQRVPTWHEVPGTLPVDRPRQPGAIV